MRWSAPVHPWTVALVCLAAATGAAQAGEIYKSVDANGTVVYSDQRDPSRPQSTVVLTEDPRYPPHEMHVCGPKNCFTLILANGSYRRADGTDDTWTIETFTPDSVRLRRHGAATGNSDITYSGQVAHDRLVGVNVNGVPTGGIDASWGTALNTLPANDAERDGGTAGFYDAPVSGAASSASAPPPVPDEEQSEIPDPGYLWTPGYWYWRDHGYFWTPGAWVRPPQPGLLWTPAFWALTGTVFAFHAGHWGPTVGFYGGVNYGHGYFGTGYTGGRWVNGAFTYNSSVNRLGPAIKNTYAEPPLANQSARPTHAVHVARGAAARAPAADDAVAAVQATTRPAPAAPTVAAPPKPVRVRVLKAALPRN